MCTSKECKTPDAPIHCKGKCHRCYKRDKGREQRKDPIKLAKIKESHKRTREKYRDERNAYMRSANRHRLYGITQEEFKKMLEDQSYCCKVCNTFMAGADVHVDHCHITKKVRGLLCKLCNLGLGYFKDAPSVLRKAAYYLENQGDSEMSELENIEQKVEGEAKTVVADIEKDTDKLVAAGEGEVKSVATAVETEVKKVEGEIKPEIKKALVEITAEEKLFLREAELEYLKAQMEIKRLSELAATKSKEYTAYIESLMKKYVIAKAEYVFDATVNAFKKL